MIKDAGNVPNLAIGQTASDTEQEIVRLACGVDLRAISADLTEARKGECRKVADVIVRDQKIGIPIRLEHRIFPLRDQIDVIVIGINKLCAGFL